MKKLNVVAMTGHRPEKIENPTWVQAAILHAWDDVVHPDRVIQGMASGVDLWSAELALDRGILLTAARPWAGHKPRVIDREIYKRVMADADSVVNVHEAEGYPGAWIYQKRNEWMVDHADVVVAVWDGSPGGTANCVNYAIKRGSDIYRIDPVVLRTGWYKQYASAPVQE